MIQFYAPDILISGSLGLEESAHCMRVLRKRVGDIISVTDGRGNRFECRIAAGDAKRVELDIISQTEVPKSWQGNITLAVAPTKNADRMAWLVEKATEIGVDRIIFIKCSNSERKAVNIERLRRNAISAMDQSLKTRLPAIEGIVPIKEIVSLTGSRYFGYCDDSTPRLEFVKEYEAGKDVVILIGPEGDFSKEEVEMLTAGGFVAVTFGDERLRTETAALYGVTAIHVINNMS